MSGWKVGVEKVGEQGDYKIEIGFDGVTSSAKIDFDNVAFWVQMINMPLACMCKDVGFQISASMGIVEEVDTDEEGISWGEYLWVRIQIDLKMPLSRG
jgi:hypothetical protein